MITAQDIREKTFDKAFNGYNMSQVDQFLDEIAADLTTMAKEAAATRSKMKVLVEKVEEYRSTEDSMRLALMSAQKMGTQIESDAQNKADAILAQARDSADRLTRRATDGIANEEAKLEEAKKATIRFFEHMRTVCEKQIEFYDRLSKMRLVGEEESPAAQNAEAEGGEAPAPEDPAGDAQGVSSRETDVEDTVRSIETNVESAALDPEERITVDTEIPEEEEEPTRRFGDEGAGRKKRSFDDFRFDEE